MRLVSSYFVQGNLESCAFDCVQLFNWPLVWKIGHCHGLLCEHDLSCVLPTTTTLCSYCLYVTGINYMVVGGTGKELRGLEEE